MNTKKTQNQYYSLNNEYQKTPSILLIHNNTKKEEVQCQKSC